ncbi:MAG TPA: class I SAM-dependent methyltransferase [Polyangiaceae bacterium]|nr:class I SAM-dependent methyltransferase [Polyangiaceae bacterium]
MSSGEPDPWLERWLPLVVERSAGKAVLELGCGSGRDSSVLAAAGLAVIGIDSSPEQLEQARARVPKGTFYEGDIRDGFPDVSGFGVILASLVLHYFSWDETTALAHRLLLCLRYGGVLLVRVNSTHDHEHGASGHPELGENYYLVDGKPKRFFDRDALMRLFDGSWNFVHLEERVIQRYARPKAIWEAVLERPVTGP